MPNIETLPLNSPRWRELETSCGETGELTAQLLAQIRADKDSEEFTVADALKELFQQICHQGCVGQVAYAVVPHLIDIAERTTGAQRLDLLAWVGAVIGDSVSRPDEVPPVPDDLVETYDKAKQRALELATAELAHPIADPVISLYLLQIVAAYHRHTTIANLIQSWPGYTCPMCGEEWCATNDAYYDPLVHSDYDPASS
jgi:hypothetical protein